VLHLLLCALDWYPSIVKDLISDCIFILVSRNVKRFNFNLLFYIGILDWKIILISVYIAILVSWNVKRFNFKSVFLCWHPENGKTI
jgi:hypothetical protein